jgi:predicted aspartyl protease
MHHALVVGLAATTAAAGHVSIPFSRQKFRHPLAHVKRDDEPFALEALNNITGGGYYSEFAVGTPPQNISFLLDTGSSDTWVNSVEANLCNSQTQQAAMGFCQTQCERKSHNTMGERSLCGGG